MSFTGTRHSQLLAQPRLANLSGLKLQSISFKSCKIIFSLRVGLCIFNAQRKALIKQHFNTKPCEKDSKTERYILEYFTVRT